MSMKQTFMMEYRISRPTNIQQEVNTQTENGNGMAGLCGAVFEGGNTRLLPE